MPSLPPGEKVRKVGRSNPIKRTATVKPNPSPKKSPRQRPKPTY
jgi:hypothetical protein